MAQGTRQRRAKSRQEPLSIVQWNCRGFKNPAKRANFRLYLETLHFLTPIVALQEPGASAKISGYNTFQRDPSTCILVHKAYTAQEVDLDLQITYSYTMVTVSPLRRSDPQANMLNIYSTPTLKYITFADIFSRALKIAS